MHEGVKLITNPHLHPIEVSFEPWGTRRTLAPGEAFRVVAVSCRPGRFEIERSNAFVAVYAWQGATMQVYRADELVLELSTEVPEVPDGVSTMSIIRLAFGQSGDDDELSDGP